MTNRWMITAATAALIAGTGLANAQGNMGHEGGAAGGAAVQQSAPSSPGAGASAHEGAGMKASQSEEKGAIKNQRAQQEVKPGAAMGAKPAGEKSAEETSKGDKSKSMSSQNEKGTPSKDMKAEEHQRNGNMKAEGQERNGNMKAEGQDRNGSMKAESRDGKSTTSAESRSQTTGQAGAGAKLSTEQRTKITSVIRSEHVAPVTNVNFPVSIGTRVPREIGFHPLPTEIVTIYPEWRGYEFFLVRDQIVVVDPRTLEIVAVLEA
ncbi:DUF1236 domain-containing protein [Bradyrhizobium sp.]|uniref:DUF1236 domain-containing protein n=1 Tax=Bradyrhizobium sp. TaxID=376 RepID=UPI003C5E433C